jgi:mRNA interferase MazF
VQRSEVWWADLGDPAGPEPGFRRPVVVVQADAFNRSRLPTTIVVVLTSSLGLVEAPGNVLVSAKESGLPRDAVANVTQIATVDAAVLTERAGRVPARLMRRIDQGLQLVLALSRT